MFAWFSIGQDPALAQREAWILYIQITNACIYEDMSRTCTIPITKSHQFDYNESPSQILQGHIRYYAHTNPTSSAFPEIQAMRFTLTSFSPGRYITNIRDIMYQWHCINIIDAASGTLSLLCKQHSIHPNSKQHSSPEQLSYNTIGNGAGRPRLHFADLSFALSLPARPSRRHFLVRHRITCLDARTSVQAYGCYRIDTIMDG